FDPWTEGVVFGKGMAENIESKAGRGFILIQGQSATAARLCFEFARDESTRQLLEALCRHDKEGGKSWAFELGESHKRVVANWIRENQALVVQKLEPEVDRLD
ncbi:hypothetical protein N9068_01585, partial [bacterium]|nr:hypothetical protein [bacterium]